MAADEDFDGFFLIIVILLGVCLIIGFLCLVGSIIGFLLPGEAPVWPYVLLGFWAANSLLVPVVGRLRQGKEEFWRKKNPGMWNIAYILYPLGLSCVIVIDFLLLPLLGRLSRKPDFTWN